MLESIPNERDYDALTEQLYSRRDLAIENVHGYLDMVKRHMVYTLSNQLNLPCSLTYHREHTLVYQSEYVDVSFKINDTFKVKYQGRVALTTRCTGIFEEIQEIERLFNKP